METPKKYWWIAAAVVPIVVAGIAIIPKMIGGGDESDGQSKIVEIHGDETEIQFNTVNLIIAQAQEVLPGGLSDRMLAALDQAHALLAENRFEDAIPLLKSVEEEAPVPALLNNLGAAYIATDNQSAGRRYLDQAVAADPGNSAAKHNLEQLVAAPDVNPTDDYFAGPGDGYVSVRLDVECCRVEGLLRVTVNGTRVGNYREHGVYGLDPYLTDGRNTITIVWQSDGGTSSLDAEIQAQIVVDGEWVKLYQVELAAGSFTRSLELRFAD